MSCQIWMVKQWSSCLSQPELTLLRVTWHHHPVLCFEIITNYRGLHGHTDRDILIVQCAILCGYLLSQCSEKNKKQKNKTAHTRKKQLDPGDFCYLHGFLWFPCGWLDVSLVDIGFQAREEGCFCRKPHVRGLLCRK